MDRDRMFTILQLFVAMSQVQYVYSSGTLELLFKQYNNSAGTLGLTNDVCDPGASPAGIMCDQFFLICVDHYLGNDNADSCLYAKHLSVVHEYQADYNSFGSTIGGLPNPIVVPINELQSNLILQIDVRDDDGSEDGARDWVDQIRTFLPVSALQPQWTDLTVYGTRQNDKTSMELSYTVYCDTLWYGERCDVFCFPRDNPDDGHYTCDAETGHKTCMPGWADTNTNCTTQIDECASNPCLNNAYCQDLLNGYRCVCYQGTNGTLCEDEFDECLSDPCLNGGTCDDRLNGYICTCSFNYAGDHCEIYRPKQI